MDKDLSKIDTFIQNHHVMSLATTVENELSVCSLFYVYMKEKNSFIVASDDKTTHIQHIKQNMKVAGNIVLETKTVGKIQGVQFRGEFIELQDDELKKLYFKKFPYALVLAPKLWQIKVKYFKMTDNTLGFGKKLIYNF
ncbi:MAG: pyridoxamine 5'-phosphate oxidase family protein [Campylobacterota bacterium]|nr:pyridoxamine 5'-phosphate oxidase family protein [Campylobacterota bacterium]